MQVFRYSVFALFLYLNRLHSKRFYFELCRQLTGHFLRYEQKFSETINLVFGPAGQHCKFLIIFPLHLAISPVSVLHCGGGGGRPGVGKADQLYAIEKLANVSPWRPAVTPGSSSPPPRSWLPHLQAVLPEEGHGVASVQIKPGRSKEKERDSFRIQPGPSQFISLERPLLFFRVSPPCLFASGASCPLAWQTRRKARSAKRRARSCERKTKGAFI